MIYFHVATISVKELNLTLYTTLSSGCSSQTFGDEDHSNIVFKCFYY